MLVLDLLIEPVAPLLGFWIFDSPVAPLQNYIGWFAIGVIHSNYLSIENK